MKTNNTKNSGIKSVAKVLLTILLLLIGILIIMLAGLTALEYKPEPLEPLTVENNNENSADPTKTLRIMTWNIGYGALGDNADFFMDGGKQVKTADKQRVRDNMEGIIKDIRNINPDIALLQEVDVNSTRSSKIDEIKKLEENLPDKATSFAYNYRVPFIPYPIPPIGKVDAGILTMSDYRIKDASRHMLPCPFSWPERLANLKRCITVNHIPLKGSDKQLAIINLHLEAYDDGNGKLAQTEKLLNIMERERTAGNYVIAGGDFNQTFPGIPETLYPIKKGLWRAGKINYSSLNADHWKFIIDSSTPSCRSLDRPYANADKKDFQYYLIDGFCVSNDIKIKSVKTHQLEFRNTDHNPVVLEVQLQEPEKKKASKNKKKKASNDEKKSINKSNRKKSDI